MDKPAIQQLAAQAPQTQSQKQPIGPAQPAEVATTGLVALSREEALALLNRKPSQLSNLVHVRSGNLVTSLIKNVFSSQTAFAELRGSSLVLYPVSIRPLLTSSENSQQRMEKLEQAIDSRRLAQIVEAELVTVIDLKDVCITSVPARFAIIFKEEGQRPLEIRLRSFELYSLWWKQIQATSAIRNVDLSDFEIIRTLGQGAGGKVYLVFDKVGREHLALKIVEKSIITARPDKYRHALDERLLMELSSKHPFVLQLKYAFQSEDRLYMASEYCEGGDLFEFMRKRGRPLPQRQVKRIMAQIILALEHIHSLGAIYRDLKLENVLLDRDGHVRIADFGLAKILPEREFGNSFNRTYSNPGVPSSLNTTNVNWGTTTFCGTREYVAPEMLSGHPYGQSIDLWALGILMYETLCGRTPFYAANRDQVYEKILNADLLFPHHLHPETVDLLSRLLTRDVEQRIGTGPGGIAVLKSHPFFADVDWDGVYRKFPHPDNLDLLETLGSAATSEDIPSEPVDLGFSLDMECLDRELSTKGSKRDWAFVTKKMSSRSNSKTMSRAFSSPTSMISGYDFIAGIDSSVDDVSSVMTRSTTTRSTATDRNASRNLSINPL